MRYFTEARANPSDLVMYFIHIYTSKFSAHAANKIRAQLFLVSLFPAPREKRSSLYSLTVVVAYFLGISAFMHVSMQEIGVS